MSKNTNHDVVVRMFCQGLGDCFLITIPQDSKPAYNILIDCGVAKGTSADLMRQAARGIVQLTKPDPQSKKGVIDLLIVTHEHLDHVSGFSQASAIFENEIEIRNIWFAWTENPRDKLANQLRGEAKKAKAALSAIQSRLGALANGSTRLLQLDGVMAFSDLGAKAGDLETGMENLRKWSKALGDDQRKYLLPGERLNLPGAQGGIAEKVNAYVLGPPHDREKIRRINPSTKNPETYDKQKHAAAGVAWAWTAAATFDVNDEELCANFDRSQPFDKQWRNQYRIDANRAVQWDNPQSDPLTEQFFENRYFDNQNRNDVRGIDDDWLWSGAQRLALHLDSFTNNTSLVVAFELPRSRKVLLFAGDAQVGNWLSWHDHQFSTDTDKTCTAEELLNRTAFYKVGHHGSHNATLRKFGLEMMNHPDLIAMVPVEGAAVKRLRYGEMPLVSLMKELQERCERRVLQLDKMVQHVTFDSHWKTPPLLSQELIDPGNGKKRHLWVGCPIRD